MLRFTLAVLTAAAVVEPGTAQQKSAPYLAASRSRRSNNGGYGAISPKRSHPLWEVLRSAKLYDDQQRPWDFFRDMDQANGYRHDNVFDNIDLDGNKELEHSEFMWAFTSKGHTNQAGQIMWDRDDKDKDGIITFVEFDGFKGIGDSNNLIEYPEFHSFMRRNRDRFVHELPSTVRHLFTDEGIKELWDRHPKTSDGVISWHIFEGPKGTEPKHAKLSRHETRESILAQRESRRATRIQHLSQDVFGRFDVNEDGMLSEEEYRVSLEGGHSLSHIHYMFEYEDEDGDGMISYEEFNGPKGFFTEEQLRALFRFEDLLTPFPLTENETRAAIITDFTGKMEAWADERFVDQRLEKLGESGLVTPENARKALEMLRNNEFPVPRHWEMVEIVRAGAMSVDGRETGAVAQIMLPMVRYLAIRYETSQIPEIRDIMIELLNRGMSPLDVSPWVQDTVPIMQELLKAFHMDFLMNAAIVKQAKKAYPVYTDRKRRVGLGTLHHITEEISNVVTKHLFQIGDQMRLTNCSFEEAYKAMAEHPGNRGVEWRGDWFNTEFMGLQAGSQTFRDVVEEWNGPSGPNTFIHRSVGVNVGEDLFMSYTDLLLEYPKIDLAEEVAVQLPQHEWNILHIAVLHGWMRTPAYLLGKLQEIVEALGDDTATVQRVRDDIGAALLQQDWETRRTPLHSAALMYGCDSEIFKSLIGLERFARGVTSNSNDYSDIASELARFESVLDKLGNTPRSFCDGTPTFESPDGEWHVADVSPEYFRMYGALNLGRDLVRRKFVQDNPQPELVDSDPREDGGWTRFGVRSDLDKYPGRCDILEVQGLPSPKKLKEYMDASIPVVMRGAGRELNLPRQLLTEENIRRRFGDVNVSLGHIPYADQFDSAYNPKVKTVSKLSDYIDGFGESGVVGNQKVPEYLFSTDFYLKNPRFLDNFTAPFNMIRNISGTTVTQGALSTDFIGLELNAQAFIGPPASGAPMHFHQAALNYLAYGRKRWSLLRPEDAIYSVLPAVQWFTQQNENFDGVLEFVQEAEDLVILPNFWSHATLNLEASLGFAFEFEYRPWLSKINPDLYNRLFRQREEKLHRGWYIPPDYAMWAIEHETKNVATSTKK